MSPKRILHVHLSDLPKCRELRFIDFRKYEPVSNFMLNRFLYRGCLTGKF